jgi:hypothetical protein
MSYSLTFPLIRYNVSFTRYHENNITNWWAPLRDLKDLFSNHFCLWLNNERTFCVTNPTSILTSNNLAINVHYQAICNFTKFEENVLSRDVSCGRCYSRYFLSSSFSLRFSVATFWNSSTLLATRCKQLYVKLFSQSEPSRKDYRLLKKCRKSV